MSLILLFTLPALKAMNSSKPLGLYDYLLAAIILALIVVEYIADQQQFKRRNADRKKQVKLMHYIKLDLPIPDCGLMCVIPTMQRNKVYGFSSISFPL